MKSIVLISIFLMTAGAFANEPILSKVARICGQDDLNLKTCKGLQVGAPLALNAKQNKLVEKIIDSSTNTWADTVLEGDTDTLFDGLKYTVRPLIVNNHRVVAYKIRFSYLGWETSCAKDDYDNSKPETYKDCAKGRISETDVASADFSDSDVLVGAELFLDKKPAAQFRLQSVVRPQSGGVGDCFNDFYCQGGMISTGVTEDQCRIYGGHSFTEYGYGCETLN